ncbi:MAG: polymer-forming cytoskeletal protein [Candidatus Goldiibacteriota bacterium]
MFGKAGGITLIAPGCEVKGHLISKGGIRIDGKVEGNITCTGTVTIGEQALVKGDVEAKNILIGGKVTGDVIAKQKLEILNTGKMHGDIRTPKLIVAEGVIFEGTCEMEKAIQESGQKK